MINISIGERVRITDTVVDGSSGETIVYHGQEGEVVFNKPTNPNRSVNVLFDGYDEPIEMLFTEIERLPVWNGVVAFNIGDRIICNVYAAYTGVRIFGSGETGAVLIEQDSDSVFIIFDSGYKYLIPAEVLQHA